MNADFLVLTEKAFSSASALIAALSVIFLVVSAFKSGSIKKLHIGPVSVEGVIIFAFATHEASDLFGTIIKVVSGTVIDAVSALFSFSLRMRRNQ